MIHDVWDELVALATLGTERRGFAPPTTAGALGAALAQLPAGDPPVALLGAAALVAQARRAGAVPAMHLAPALPPAAPDERPVIGSAATAQLRTLLDRHHRLLPEWLAMLARSGRRLPDLLLPALLQYGENHAELREPIQAAIGPRGHWLAAQNPLWEYACGLAGDQFVDLTGWETAPRATRHILLTRLRTQRPDEARALIAAALPHERAEERAALLTLIAHGLSADDEPLLEVALADRSSTVQRTAAGLLTQLPQSALVARMAMRAQALLSWVPPGSTRLLGMLAGRPAQLVAELPVAGDAALVRDGVDPLPAHRHGYGERAWRLMQILAAVPPTTWSDAWHTTPAAIIAAAARSEWHAPLLEGFAAATQRHRDAQWAAALLSHAPDYAGLLELLAVPHQETLLLTLLRGNCTPLHEHPVLELLRHTRHTWSTALAEAALRAVYQHLRTTRDHRDYGLRAALIDEFALRLPPAFAQQIAADWPRELHVRERWQTPIDQLLTMLQLRQEMLAALATPPVRP